MFRKVNFQAAFVLTLSLFQNGEVILSLFYISSVNWRLWLPAALSTFCWKSFIQYLISWKLFLLFKYIQAFILSINITFIVSINITGIYMNKYIHLNRYTRFLYACICFTKFYIEKQMFLHTQILSIFTLFVMYMSYIFK